MRVEQMMKQHLSFCQQTIKIFRNRLIGREKNDLVAYDAGRDQMIPNFNYYKQNFLIS